MAVWWIGNIIFDKKFKEHIKQAQARNMKIGVYFYDQSMGEIYEFSYVYDIKIIYSVSTGFNIYIQITKLLQNNFIRE